jgi:hypothetical protein
VLKGAGEIIGEAGVPMDPPRIPHWYNHRIGRDP